MSNVCSWIQQDPGEILQSVKVCIENVCQQCKEKNISLSSIKGTSQIILVTKLS